MTEEEFRFKDTRKAYQFKTHDDGENVFVSVSHWGLHPFL